MDPFGNFVAIWESFGQVPEGRAVFGRYLPALAAPVVTDGLCNGAPACDLPIGVAFSIEFDFADPDGDAVLWNLTLVL